MTAKTFSREILTFQPPSTYELLTEFTIPGEPGRKSNQRRIVRNRRTGQPSIIKSKKAIAYREQFLRGVPANVKNAWGSREDPLLLWAHIFYASHRPDLSSEMLMDLLQEAGVVSNDRWIKAQVLFGSVDKENPRSEISLYRIIH